MVVVGIAILRSIPIGRLLLYHGLKRPPHGDHVSRVQQRLDAALDLVLFGRREFVVPSLSGGEGVGVLGVAGFGGAEGALHVYLGNVGFGCVGGAVRGVGWIVGLFGFVVALMMIHICFCF